MSELEFIKTNNDVPEVSRPMIVKEQVKDQFPNDEHRLQLNLDAASMDHISDAVHSRGLEQLEVLE